VEDDVDHAMVRAINEVGHIMGKKTIAEFVENEKIFNLLNKLGVDYAQGYGIGKPVPLDELTLIKPFTGTSK
jgi:EAL domain-containing protein (putative c-di-GMP-specific phosphodiesterase class I)